MDFARYRPHLIATLSLGLPLVGSQLARMLAAHFRNNKTTEIVAVALDDDSAGQKATGMMTFTGASPSQYQ